jgi:diacylglycerol kinase (ATP)
MNTTQMSILGRLARATRYSLQGLRAAWRHEQAFREEVVLLVLLAPVAWWLGETGMERALLLASLSLILIVELLNSALEAAVDRSGTEKDALAERAKDLGSAAVLIALLQGAVVWAVVLFP